MSDTLTPDPNDPTVGLDAIKRLTRDLKNAAKTLGAGEARFLVSSYYTMQEDRIRAAHQVRQLSKSEEPHEVLAWLGSNVDTLESQIKRALEAYALAQPIGQWAMSITGIGPVISAGMIAHVDITKAPTAGHIWRFAGLDPTSVWNKGEKRPWNAALKTLTWKIGESFVKVSGHEKDVYGKLYIERKLKEIERNESGGNAESAAASFEKRKFGDDTEAKLWYTGCLTPADAQTIRDTPTEKRLGMAKKLAGEPGSGLAMLAPQHVHARAKRWVVKIFISHFQEAYYFSHYGVLPPRPYILTKEGGHAHEIVPPNQHMIPGWAEARAKAGLR